MKQIDKPNDIKIFAMSEITPMHPVQYLWSTVYLSSIGYVECLCEQQSQHTHFDASIDSDD